MIRILTTTIVILLVLVALVFFNLGMDYINFDHGLHPLIAFPVATLAVVALYACTDVSILIYPEDDHG